MGPGAVLAVNLLLALLDRAQAIGALISTAQKEGRDVTEAELDALGGKVDEAKKALDAAIVAAEAASKALG